RTSDAIPDQDAAGFGQIRPTFRAPVAGRSSQVVVALTAIPRVARATRTQAANEEQQAEDTDEQQNRDPGNERGDRASRAAHQFPSPILLAFIFALLPPGCWPAATRAAETLR